MAALVVMPKLGLTMREGAVVRWLVEVGDQVTQGQLLCEIETDKITSEVEAPSSGVLPRRVEPDQDVPVGAAIALLGAPGEEGAGALFGEVGEAPPPAAAAASPRSEKAPSPPAVKLAAGAAPAPASSPSAAQPDPPGGREAVSPVARRLAAELGVDLATVRGSGPGGRIVRRDVERAAGIEESGD